MNNRRYITCPWCGYENKNSGEFEENSGEIDCGNCGEDFWYEREIEVSYNTGKVVPFFEDWLDKNYNKITDTYYTSKRTDTSYSIEEIKSQYCRDFKTNVRYKE